MERLKVLISYFRNEFLVTHGLKIIRLLVIFAYIGHVKYQPAMLEFLTSNYHFKEALETEGYGDILQYLVSADNSYPSVMRIGYPAVVFLMRGIIDPVYWLAKLLDVMLLIQFTTYSIYACYSRYWMWMIVLYIYRCAIRHLIYAFYRRQAEENLNQRAAP